MTEDQRKARLATLKPVFDKEVKKAEEEWAAMSEAEQKEFMKRSKPLRDRMQVEEGHEK